MDSDFLIYIVFLIVGIICGCVVGISLYKTFNKFGTLVVDKTDPNKDVFRIELDMDLDKVNNKDYIVLEVSTKYKKKVININQVQEE